MGQLRTLADWDYSAAPECRFFAMLANNGSAEGSYGTRTGGTGRPVDATGLLAAAGPGEPLRWSGLASASSIAGPMRG